MIYRILCVSIICGVTLSGHIQAATGLDSVGSNNPMVIDGPATVRHLGAMDLFTESTPALVLSMREMGLDLLSADRSQIQKWLSESEAGNLDLPSGTRGKLAKVYDLLSEIDSVSPATADHQTLFAGKPCDDWRLDSPRLVRSGRYGVTAVNLDDLEWETESGVFKLHLPAGLRGMVGLRSSTPLFSPPKLFDRFASIVDWTLEPASTGTTALHLLCPDCPLNETFISVQLSPIREQDEVEAKDSDKANLYLSVLGQKMDRTTLDIVPDKLRIKLSPNGLIEVYDSSSTLLQALLPHTFDQPEADTWDIAVSLEAERNQPGTLALKRLTKLQQPLHQIAYPDLYPAASTAERLFDGRGYGSLWRPYLHGRADDGHLKFQDGSLVIHLDMDVHRSRAGLFSPQPIIWLDPFDDGSMASLVLRSDPSSTTGFSLVLSAQGGNQSNPDSSAFSLDIWKEQPGYLKARTRIGNEVYLEAPPIVRFNRYAEGREDREYSADFRVDPGSGWVLQGAFRQGNREGEWSAVRKDPPSELPLSGDGSLMGWPDLSGEWEARIPVSRTLVLEQNDLQLSGFIGDHPIEGSLRFEPPASVPEEIELRIGNQGVQVQAPGFPRTWTPWTDAAPGSGLLVWVYALPGSADKKASLRLNEISLRKTLLAYLDEEPPVDGVEPLGLTRLFTEETKDKWSADQSVENDEIDRDLAFSGDGSVHLRAAPTNEPSARWHRFGLSTDHPVATIDNRLNLTDYRIQLDFVDLDKGGVEVVLADSRQSRNSNDGYRVRLIRHAGGRLDDVVELSVASNVGSSNSALWRRFIDPKWVRNNWNRSLFIDLGDNHLTASLPDGPIIRAPLEWSVHTPLYLRLNSLAATENEGAINVKVKASAGWKTPPNMTALQREQLIDIEQFDPQRFLDALINP